MNKALMFHMRLSVTNSFKQILKRPLKTLGIIVAVIYFAFMPFFFKDLVDTMHLNNTEGFVLINSVLTLYLTMPVTLTYFKRNGVNFKKPDVNFMFASPISPKQVLFYGLIKQAYLKVIIQLAAIIAAVYMFNIPLGLSLIYGVLSLIISSVFEYSLALIMYASESLTDKHKKFIKLIVYIMLFLLSVFIIYYLATSGFTMDSVTSLMQHPLIIMTPLFGWKLGFLNLVFLGATPLNIISSVLYILASITLFMIAYKMDCKGDYYEDGIKFTEQQAKLLEKKGNVSFSEAFGKKRKVHKVQGSLKGSGAKAIFHKQFIELRRVRPFFLTFGDLMMIVVSVGASFIFFDSDIEAGFFFTIVSGISLYLALFFQPDKRWKEEFNHYFMYLIPDQAMKKLWYSTLLEVMHVVVQAVLLTLPAAIIIKASPAEVIATIVVQVLVKILMLYKSILFEGYIANKLGVTVAQFVSLFISVLIVIIPGILIFASLFISLFLAVTIIAIYCLILTSIFMFLCTRAFTNIENLKA